MKEDNTQVSLIKNEIEDAPAMAVSEKEGVKGIMANTANPNTLRNCIKIAVTRAFFANSKDIVTNQLTFIIDEIKAEILRSYPTIRLEEIGLAIHKGSVGDYGQIYSLSLNTFVGFIRTYMTSEARVIATKEFLKIDFDKPENKPSQEEIEKGRRQNILDAFEKFKRTGTYKDYGNYIYSLLVKYGVLNFTDADKKTIWETAKANVYNGIHAQGFRGGFKAHEAVAKLKAIQDNPEHIYFYIEAKKIAICMFFKELVNMETELADLLETE